MAVVEAFGEVAAVVSEAVAAVSVAIVAAAFPDRATAVAGSLAPVMAAVLRDRATGALRSDLPQGIARQLVAVISWAAPVVESSAVEQEG